MEIIPLTPRAVLKLAATDPIGAFALSLVMRDLGIVWPGEDCPPVLPTVPDPWPTSADDPKGTG